MNDFKLKYTKLPWAIAPTRAHPNDAGLDLYTIDSCTVKPGEVVKLDTGVAFEIPTGYVGIIKSRSSLFSKGVNTSGTIDSDYRGTIKVCIANTSDATIHIKAGDRVAQMVITPCMLWELDEVESLSATERGCGGFGSTGN